MDALLDSLLPFAQQQLGKHGEFLPFGSVMTTAGEVKLVAGLTGNERPPSQELIEVIVAEMRRQATADEIKAVGICYDVRIRAADGSLTDAIAVSLEHRNGEPVDVFMPYEKRRFGGPRFGELTANAGTRRVFG